VSPVTAKPVEEAGTVIQAIEIVSAQRRAHARVQRLVAHRPSDRRQILMLRSVEDLERLRELTAEQREAFDDHLARVAAEA
jgi:DNA-directed RNA polymerase specialized sigma24 family protein